MKRELIFGFIFVLLFVNFVSGADVNVSNFTDVSSVKEKTNQVLEKQIVIPDNLQIVTRALFGLKTNDKVDFQTFIILSSFFVILFILLHSAVSIIFYGLKSWLAAVIIAILIGFSGAIKEVVVFFFGLGSLFGFLRDWILVRFIFILIILIILFYGLFGLLNKIKKEAGLEEFSQIGRDIGFMGAISRALRRIKDKKD